VPLAAVPERPPNRWSNDPKSIFFMKKALAYHRWLDVGYELFGKEGPEGLQVERIARILDLNKSGFYHYFGDLDSFIDKLLSLHRGHAEEFAGQFNEATQFDPDFYRVILSDQRVVLFHMQLVRFRHVSRYHSLYHEVNALVDPAIVRLFAPYMQLEQQPELASRFFDQARDMFYSRITEANMNEEFLRRLISDVKELAREFSG
jgi:AcrR family transcriptional regulator